MARPEVIDGIPYVTIGSLVEEGRPAGTFAEVTLEPNGRLGVQVAGGLPRGFQHGG